VKTRDTTHETRVLVVGGGYAGVMAANRLTQRSDLRIPLINAHPDAASPSGPPGSASLAT
jgi:succinate dehydrogenase/fumarate reductase flavoprotein subunit